MDPVTAAGLGLSVTSLALQLFAGCIKLYQVFIDIANMPKDVEHLRIRLQLEQTRLLNWGDQIGLLKDVLEEPSTTLRLHRNLIFDLLLEIQRLFQDSMKISTDFGVAHNNPSTTMDVVDATPVRQLPGPKESRSLLAKTLDKFGKASEIPKRLEWVMVKRERFEKLIEQLISYNDSIVSLLDRVVVQQLYDMHVKSQLTLLQLSSKIDELQQLTRAMQVRPIQDGSPSNNIEIRSGLLGPSNDRVESNGFVFDVAQLATFKADQIHLESSPVGDQPAFMDRSTLHSLDADTTRATGTYSGKRIWLEWRDVDEHNQTPAFAALVESRIKKLTGLLAMTDKPAVFRAPQCIGCCRDVEDDTDDDAKHGSIVSRYGLVYNMPPDASDDTVIWSLLQLIEQRDKPSLTRRISLAGLVASSLMYLHSVNWLHRNVRSDNVIFFTREQHEVVPYEQPHITGFGYARPDLHDEMTEKPVQDINHDVYRHPQALGRSQHRSRKSWDIYSLGIVLVEIALWSSIFSIADIDRTHPKAKSKVRQIRDLLLSPSLLDRISSEVGQKYKDVVERCIRGGSDLGIAANDVETDPQVGAKMLDIFASEVVGRLQSIHI